MGIIRSVAAAIGIASPRRVQEAYRSRKPNPTLEQAREVFLEGYKYGLDRGITIGCMFGVIVVAVLSELGLWPHA